MESDSFSVNVREDRSYDMSIDILRSKPVYWLYMAYVSSLAVGVVYFWYHLILIAYNLIVYLFNNSPFPDVAKGKDDFMLTQKVLQSIEKHEVEDVGEDSATGLDDLD